MKDTALMRSSLHLLKRRKEAGSTQEEARKAVSQNLARTKSAKHGGH